MNIDRLVSNLYGSCGIVPSLLKSSLSVSVLMIARNVVLDA